MMKFDLSPQVVDGILAVMQEAPVPHKIVNPLVQELLRQSKDETIQAMGYPMPAKPKPATPKKKRGRPAKVANGHAQEAQAVM